MTRNTRNIQSPRFRWTFRNNFQLFNDLDISFMLYSLWGHYGSYADAANNNFDASISCGYDQPYWTPENPINDYARIGSKNLGTHYVNKSFIRLDNITVSYRLPQKWTKVVGIQDLRFNASIHNVAVFALITTVGILNQIAQWEEHSISVLTLHSNLKEQ